MASKKCQKSGARSTRFHTRPGSLKVHRDIHASLEPNNEVSLRHDGNDLSREDETGAIAADDAEDLAFFDFQIDIAQRPELIAVLKPFVML